MRALLARVLLGMLAAVTVVAGVAQAADTRTTGHWILNITFVLIALGAAMTWWVVRRYKPS